MEKSLNDKNTLLLTHKIMNLEQYYSIEDFELLLSIRDCCIYNDTYFSFNPKIYLNILSNTTVRVNFEVNGREKEFLMDKKRIRIRKVAIYKIYSENNKFIKILASRIEKYDTKDILKKINEIRFFKGALREHLNINEFPIKTYYLEEREIQNSENNTEEIEKEFILKKINNNLNLNSNNQMNFNLNKNDNSHFYQNFYNNNIINNNFNHNNNVNLMNNNNIIQYLENNKFLIMQIFNYIRQNNN